MSTRIASEVLASFYERLDASDVVAPSVVDALRDALDADKLPKADDIVQIFMAGSGDPAV